MSCLRLSPLHDPTVLSTILPTIFPNGLFNGSFNGPFIRWSTEWDEWIPKLSPRLQPLGSQSGAFWRELHGGLAVDVEDSKGNWFPGKVVDMDDAGGRAKVHYNGYACVCVCV